MKKMFKSMTVIIMCLLIAFSSVTLASAKLDRVTNFKATVLSTNNSALLTWSPVSGARTYQLQVNINGKGWQDISRTITKTSYAVTNLSYGNTYAFQVRAYNSSSDHGNYSPTVTITLKVGKVTGLKATMTSMKSVKLSWSAVSGASGYNVQKYVSGKWTTVKNTTSTSLTIKELKVNSTYKFRVRAYKTISGEKKYGDASSTISYKAGVAKVEGFKITSSDIDSANVSWTKLSGVTGYQIYKYDYSKKSKGWYKVTTVKASSAAKYTYGKLVAGTKYGFKVRAYYKGSKTYYGEFSSTVYYTPTLEKVEGLKLTNLTATKATLSWDEVDGAQGYQVYDYSSGSAVKLPTVKTNKTTIDIKNGRTYKIKVRAYTKATGETVKGTFSEACEFNSIPFAPKNLNASILESGYGRFTWDYTEGAEGYNLYVLNGSSWRLVAGEINSTSYILKDNSLLKDNTFMVRAYIKNGSTTLESADSDEFTLEVISAPVVTVGQCTATDIQLKWNAVAGANGYIIEAYDYNSSTWKIIGEASTPEFTDYSYEGSLERGSLYRVYGAVLNNNGTVLSKGIVSEPVTATTSGIIITQSAATQTISWPAKDGAAKYRVIISDKNGNHPLPDTDVNSITTVLTPDSVVLMTVAAYDRNGAPMGLVTGDITLKVNPIAILPENHSQYNQSINGQLLYLIGAINNSKSETGKITVSSTSSVSYATEKFYLGSTEFNGNDIEGLLKTLGNLSAEDKKDLESLALSNTETVNEVLTFNGGIATNSQGKNVNLARFIEPSNVSYTELYDWENPTAWKNGISSVKATPLPNGGYRFEVVIKQESFGKATGRVEPLYHPCFTTTVASLGYLSGGDVNLENQLSTVGNTLITATVNADGTLDDYTVNSPYTMRINYIVNTLLVKSFGMYITGNIISDYKFTR